MTPQEARELAVALNVAATNAEVNGNEHVDLQASLSVRLRQSLDDLQAAIDAAKRGS